MIISINDFNIASNINHKNVLYDYGFLLAVCKTELLISEECVSVSEKKKTCRMFG